MNGQTELFPIGVRGRLASESLFAAIGFCLVLATVLAMATFSALSASETGLGLALAFLAGLSTMEAALLERRRRIVKHAQARI